MIKRGETWIIKFHDLMDKEEVLRFKKLDNVLVWDDPDNIPLLQAADVLISDTSSIVYEFMLLDKPVITIDARIRLEKGINIQDVKDLRTAIDRSVSNPEEHSINRKNVLREIQPYADRANAKRVLEAAETMFTSDIMTKLSKKPRNLYRKYRARKLLNNWW
jgi:CDP-glycerol glycerophosphotransferase (TagB/SpsB family)